MRLRELKSLAQGHISCAVAFKSSEDPQGRSFKEPVGAASIVIQVPQLISNWKALRPASAGGAGRLNLSWFRSLSKWMTGRS